MTHFDVFNGDADGLCALHQLRLANPVAGALVTGVKRDTQLIERLPAVAGDRITALDIGLKQNSEVVTRLLSIGVQITWIDHHYAGEIPEHPAFCSTIDTSPDVCTSILVDRQLGGTFRPWAIAAAFGDGLAGPANALARDIGLSSAQTTQLQQIGELLNYNAYGETLADLWCDPARLYTELHAFGDPWKFGIESAELARIGAGFADDIAMTKSLMPLLDRPGCAVWILPDAPWSRRVSGVLASRLAVKEPQRAHAIVTYASEGDCLRVSVRAPAQIAGSPKITVNAHNVCRQFHTGGGRETAAGINELPQGDFERFLGVFSDAYA